MASPLAAPGAAGLALPLVVAAVALRSPACQKGPSVGLCWTRDEKRAPIDLLLRGRLQGSRSRSRLSS